MNFDFFMFLLFMSIASFAMAFLAYGFVVRFWGKTGWVAKIGQVVLVPILIILFDFVTIATPVRYRYYVGSLPLAALAALIFYFYFIKGDYIIFDFIFTTKRITTTNFYFKSIIFI